MAELGFVPMAAGSTVKVGTYTGDGAERRTINLGVTPKWISVWHSFGEQSNEQILRGGFALTNHPCQRDQDFPTLQITNNGFIVSEYAEVATNTKGYEYYFLYGI